MLPVKPPADLDVQIFPYCKVDGVRTFKDSFIFGLYDRMVKDHVAEDFFYDDLIPTRDEWLRAMQHPMNFLYVIFANRALAGIGLLNEVKDKSASIHFTSFRSWLSARQRATVAREILGKLIKIKSNKNTKECLFDVFVGKIMKSNHRALWFARKMGFSTAGEIPSAAWNSKKGHSEPLVLTYFLRENLK